jgi:hypothetical protein
VFIRAKMALIGVVVTASLVLPAAAHAGIKL